MINMHWEGILKNVPKCPTCGKKHKAIGFDDKVGWHWNPKDKSESKAKVVDMKDINWNKEE